MTVVPLDLPDPLPIPFRANWQTRVTFENEGSTNVDEARETAAEDRRQLWDRPARGFSVALTGLAQDEANKLWMRVLSMSRARTVVPVYQDEMRTTASSSGTTLNVDTALRRLFVGARVLVFDLDTDGYPDQFEYRTIAAVNANDIDLTGDALSNTYAAGSYVFPVMDVEIELESSSLRLATDDKATVVIAGTEVVGPSALPYLESGNPTGFGTYLGDPILDVEHDWTAEAVASVTSPGESFGLGRGVIVEPRAERGRVQYTLALNQLGRDVAWPVQRFLESRAGRRRPFWMISPQNLFEVVASTTTHIDIAPVGSVEHLQDFLSHVGIVEHDGDVHIRGVDSVVDMATFWRVTYDSTIPAPPNLSEICKVTSAHRVRLADDVFREEWTTPEVASYSVTLIDLLQEKTSTVSGAQIPDPTINSIADVDDLYLWCSASGNAWVSEISPFGPDRVTRPFPLGVSLTGSDVDFLLDCRQDHDDPSLNEPYLQRHGAANTAPGLAYFSKFWPNHGQRTLYHFAITPNFAGFSLENSQEPFFDNTLGMTIFVCARFAGLTDPAASRVLVNRSGVLEWEKGASFSTDGHVRFFATADTSVPAADITYTQPLDSALYILAVRWDPGVSAEVFIDGGAAAGSAASPAASLDTATRDTDVLQFRGNIFGGGGGLPQGPNDNIERMAFSNEFLIFRRALTDEEMDLVGDHIAKMYGLEWSDVL